MGEWGGRDVAGELGELLLHKGHKRRAAGGGQKSLFQQLARFLPGDHVGPQGGFDYVRKAQCLQPRKNLAHRDRVELAGHGGATTAKRGWFLPAALSMEMASKI